MTMRHFRNVMAGELRRLGHERGEQRRRGEEAVAQVETVEPEVVLAESSAAGGWDGLEALKAIRGHNASIEVIMLDGTRSHR